MRIGVWFALLVSVELVAKDIALPGDSYESIQNGDIEMIYDRDHRTIAPTLVQKEQEVIEDYQKSFGFKLDDKLYMGLLSTRNQIANAFSTQMPLNMQMDYGAGTLYYDRFASKSWIDMLLFHESAHNFQNNPKKNPLSRWAHKIFKNSFYSGTIIPIFPVPNNLCSPFMMEGNAVLNESLHDNGGRLFSGATLAIGATQARAGYITPERTYNQHLFFPYGRHNYLIGGLFSQFLAERFGVDRTNRYFYNHSGQWIPIFTEHAFRESFGISYTQAIEAFNKWITARTQGFIATKGELLAHAKAQTTLNRVGDEILFVGSNDRQIPYLYRYDRKRHTLQKHHTTLPNGKIFKINGHYYSRCSAHTSSTRISAGLFDQEGNPYVPALSKVVQSIDPDGADLIYFDIPRSLSQPVAYRKDQKIGQVNSSIFKDDAGHLYYFRQEGDKRTLYRDTQPLFHYRGWYGFVADVDRAGRIYIVADSSVGSTVYRYDRGDLVRILAGDDLLDAKVIDADHLLVERVSAEGIDFMVAKTKPMHSEIAFIHPNLPTFAKSSSGHAQDQKQRVDLSAPHSYTPIANLHYSSLDNYVTYDSANGINYDLTAKWSDPLTQNSFALFTSRFSDDSIVGAGYDNSQMRLKYGLSAYGVLEHDQNISSRGYGLSAYLSYPIYRKMYQSIDTKLSYTLSYDRADRAPLTLNVSLSDARHFGHSMYLNSGKFLDITAGLDRGDLAYGAKGYLIHDLGSQWYASLLAGGAHSQVNHQDTKRGLKLESYQNRLSDALNFEMPSLKNDIYIKDIIKAGVSVTKVLDWHHYFFTFPISLRREAISAKYRYYDLGFIKGGRRSFNEYHIGLRADLLYFNALELPFEIEYIENPDLKESSHLRVLLDMVF